MAIEVLVGVWLNEAEVDDLLACISIVEDDGYPLANGTNSARTKLEDALEELENN